MWGRGSELPQIPNQCDAKRGAKMQSCKERCTQRAQDNGAGGAGNIPLDVPKHEAGEENNAC